MLITNERQTSERDSSASSGPGRAGLCEPIQLLDKEVSQS